MILKKANNFASGVLIFFIQGLRPLLGPENICPYEIGCTTYAINMLQTHHIFKACLLILKRLLSCHPFRREYK